jgi:two-component system OmpR family response regulator
MAVPKILVVDDDSELSQMMAQFLARNGFMVYTAATGAEINQHISRGRIDLILLDVMLGEENGIELCRQLRAEQDVPIIFVSALAADHQRVTGYEVGADDYIAKPFNLDLLLARVKAVLRRVRRSSSLTYRRNTSIYRFNGWQFNSKTDEAFNPSGVQVALSQRETRLLKVLLANPHIALTRDEIITAMDITQDGHSISDNSGRALDVLVGRLRSKIETNPKLPEILRTERGVGYVFATDVDQSEA